MKVTYIDYYRGNKVMAVASAVDHAITPLPYSYVSTAEKAEMAAEYTAQMLGRLIETLADGGKLSPAQVQGIIGYNYEVTE